VDEELSFGRNLFGHNFFTNFLGGPLGSGTFPTFGWGCSSFLTTRSSRASLWSIPMLTGGHCLWLGLHRIGRLLFSSCCSKHRRLCGLSMFKKHRMNEKGRNDVEYQYIFVL